MMNLYHIGNFIYACRPDPAKTGVGVKFFCPACKRYAVPDDTHKFEIRYESGVSDAEWFGIRYPMEWRFPRV